MAKIIQQLWLLRIGLVQNIENFFEPFLQNLDPSLFQNIILGILAIFIPFAIVFLTDILDSKKQRSEFEKMVLNEEVLGTKKVFWLSVTGIVILAFFSGKDISVERKLLAINISIIIIWLFWNPFRKILRFAEGHKPEFELNFLKNLNLSKIFRFRNKLKTERMIRAWNSFWSEKSEYNEGEFTKIFAKHIDDAIKIKHFNLAVLLAETYQNNIEKRRSSLIGHKLLPKIFEWDEMSWEAEKGWLKKEDYKEKIQKIISSKYFPTFKKWILWLLRKIYDEGDLFWNWGYFQHELFPAVTKILLYSESYQFFSCFKKHSDKVETKLEKIEDEKQKQGQWNYIISLFGSFCPTFFDNINKISNKYDIWNHQFPDEWKITVANSKKRIPRVILHEFLEWTRQRIFNKYESDYDNELTGVVTGIFPNAHHDLFPSFLILLFSGDIKYAVQQIPNFFMTNTIMSWSGEKSEKEIQQMRDQKERSQQMETIDIIFDYFRDWKLLKLYKDEISEKEFSNFDDYSEKQKEEIVNRIRKRKLQETLTGLNGEEMITLCKKNEHFEYQRKIFIELIGLLLKRIP